MKDISQAKNNFAFALFKTSIQHNPNEINRFISPQSIFMDFAMLYNAAENKTKKAMEKALFLGDAHRKTLNSYEADFLNKLPHIDSTVTLTIANAIWHRKDLTPKPEFLSINRAFYKAKIEAANFKNPNTVDDINHWVSENTAGKIPSLIDQIAPGEALFLLNAVYFKGQWKYEFKSSQTQELDFFTAQQPIKTPFMFKDRRYNYAQNDQMELIEIPYGNGNYSMLALLPAKNSSVHALVENLNTTEFDALLVSLQSRSLKLWFPKWEIEYSADQLVDNLTALGMGIAFQNNADFSGLFDSERTKISQVKHKTYIKVDEEGTEAAAATSIGMVTTSMPMPTEKELRFDRPFVYLIYEKTTNTILFIGTMDNPSGS